MKQYSYRIILSLFVLLAFWSATSFLVDDQHVLTGPFATILSFEQNFSIVFSATLSTITISILGFMFSVVIASSITVLALALPLFMEATIAVLTVFRAAPIIVIAPIIHSVNHANVDATRFWVAVAMSLFPLCLLPIKQASTVPQDYLDTAKVHGASKWEIMTRITLPWAFSGLLQGMRTSNSLAVVGVVVVEMVYPSGIGRVLVTALQRSAGDLVTVSVIVITITAFILSLIIDKAVGSMHQKFYLGS